MKAKIVFLMIFLLSATTAFAETMQELSLKEANLQGLIVEGAMQEVCASMPFVKDASAETPGVYLIFSTHANFMPTSTGNASVQVFLNDSTNPTADLKPEDFPNNWARTQIPIAGLTEKNTLKICGKTSNSITKIEVLEDSKLGYYKMPVFELEKTVSDTKPIVGKELEVTLKAKNVGSEAGIAKISYWSIELNIAQITKGDAEFEGIIQPGETKTLHYFVKPKYAVQMDLASAILEFENIFGEKKKAYSNRPTLWVQEPEFKIKAFYNTPEQKTIQPGQKVNLLLTVRNDGLSDLENVSIKLEASQMLNISKTSFENLSFKAGETKTFGITASSIEEGVQELGCTAEYSDYKVVNAKCTPLTLEFEKPKQSPVLVLAIILVFIGALIYIYIYKPEKKKQE